MSALTSTSTDTAGTDITAAGTADTTTAAEAPARRSTVIVILATVTALIASLLLSTGTASATPRGMHSRSTAEASIATSVLRLLNRERSANHRPHVYANLRLKTSARNHNYAMAQADEMSHQVAGEADLGRRVTSVGYRWHTCGENIGWNSQLTRAGVLQLEQMMFAEHAPDNGHRVNILNRNFRNVGIDVYLDTTHHKVWLTTDFGHR